MTVYTYNPTTWEAEVPKQKFKPIFSNTISMNLKPSWDILDPISKQTKNTTDKHNYQHWEENMTTYLKPNKNMK